MRYRGLRRSCLEADPGFSFSSSSRPDDTVENQDKTEIGRRFPPVTPIAKKDKQKEKSTKGEPLKNRLRERSSRKQKKGISFKQRYAIRNNGKAKAYRRRFLVCFCFLLLFFFFPDFFLPFDTLWKGSRWQTEIGCEMTTMTATHVHWGHPVKIPRWRVWRTRCVCWDTSGEFFDRRKLWRCNWARNRTLS